MSTYLLAQANLILLQKLSRVLKYSLTHVKKYRINKSTLDITLFGAVMPRFKNKKCCMLDNLCSGKRAKIRCHHAKGAVRQRLLDLGFVPESEIDIVRRAPLGDPIQCKVANYNVTLRKSEASLIEVEDV